MSLEFKVFGTPRTADFAATGIIVDTGAGLLFQCRDDIDGILSPGRWGLFGGHVEPGETPADCAAREFAEETGQAYPPDAFAHAYDVYPPPPLMSVLHMMLLKAPIRAADMRVLEGCGFIIASPRQIARLDLIDYMRPAIETYLGQRVF